jgi:peptidoglycan hydrolase-like protein with peptidoglycan-binding domain
MRTLATVIVLLGAVALTRADPTIENVQRALKDQGFYYGDVTGEKNADTSAAIRRFQIRHGLQVTGELNDETFRSIQESASASPPAAATVAPSPQPDTSDSRDDSARETESPVPAQSFNPEAQDRQPRNDRGSRSLSEPHSPAPAPPPPTTTNLFVGTPYGNSSPEVQRSVVVFAQRALAKRDVYKGQFDGVFGSNLEFSLRAYQSRVGLRVTGRLDLETLAALELLPGANQPVYTPRRPMRRPHSETPVRGEWIHE